MTATFYRNQYTDGGAVTAEKWQLFNASDCERMFGSCYSLERKEVKLPECCTVWNAPWGEKIICDGDDVCELIYNAKTEHMYVVSKYRTREIW